jgi:IclR family acetate operon transcriptional repressor
MTAAVAKLGESVNLATLDGDEIVYVAQVQPSTNFMRMFTEVGRRTWPHATAVGKAILAGFPDDEVVALLGAPGCRATPRTRSARRTSSWPTMDRCGTSATRSTEGEQEVGVRCVAVQCPTRPADGDLDVRVHVADAERRRR